MLLKILLCALYTIPLAVQVPLNPLIEDYTEIFHMIDEGVIPSIQCKMNFRGHKSMRNIDGLGLIVINFYVAVLTP
jgi:hypothetical protein